MSPESLALFLHRNNLYRFFVCPECGYVGKDPVDLGSHIERHRPEDSGEKKVRPCPKGCGRVFRYRNARSEPLPFREHVGLCDGSPPLADRYQTRPKIHLDQVLCLQIATSLVVSVEPNGQNGNGNGKRHKRDDDHQPRAGDPSAYKALVRWLMYGDTRPCSNGHVRFGGSPVQNLHERELPPDIEEDFPVVD